jgi:nitrate/TMAO reductase-like tetraheme cytochrome c subunit
MKAAKLAVVGVLMVFGCLLFFAQAPAVRSAEQENHCFSCHTNPRKLIEITREIARANQDKPGASIETEGEG